MKNYRVVLFIGIIEVLIGAVTLIGTTVSIALSINTKTFNVLAFVIITGVISTLLGIGMLKFKKIAFQLLIYFSSVVILTKILIFANLIQLNGALTTIVPNFIKNSISVLYHGFIVYYLLKPGVKQIFHK